MSTRTVCIEALGDKDVSAAIEKGYLEGAFLKAVAKVTSAKIVITPECLSFSVSSEDFKKLSEQGVFSPEIVKAFEISSARMDEVDVKRSGVLARLWDTFKYHDTMVMGRPIVNCPAHVEDGSHMTLVVKRYGLAK